MVDLPSHSTTLGHGRRISGVKFRYAEFITRKGWPHHPPAVAHRLPSFPEADRIMATMPARIGSGRSGHASMTSAKSGGISGSKSVALSVAVWGRVGSGAVGLWRDG